MIENQYRINKCKELFKEKSSGKIAPPSLHLNVKFGQF